jgi:D-alanine transaminase
MAKIAYVNGSFVPLQNAAVAMEDRGYQFGDGIYEYMTFYNKRLVNLDLHLARLERSLASIEIAMPTTPAVLRLLLEDLIARNGYIDGGVYLQVTRGVARRDHPFPPATVRPSLTMAVYKPKLPTAELYHNGISVITAEDIRWKRTDIKTTSLLGNVLLKQKSIKAGARETWLFDEKGFITECSHSNCHIIDMDGRLVTHPADNEILGGTMRSFIIDIAKQIGIEVVERPFTVEEAYGAAEAFNSSCTANVLPVTEIDGRKISQGVPGPVTQKLLRAVLDQIFVQTGREFDYEGYGIAA